MPGDTTLRDLVLGYCQQVGGLIEPPAYGIDEVLLPDPVAARWKIDPFQRFKFTLETEDTLSSDGVTTLYYGHPLVETIVSELRQRPANSRFFINPVRVEKPGLRGLVEKLTFSNARPVVGAIQRTRLYHYVCFNFKASLVSDEKREMVVPVWMHLQGGYRIQAGEIQTKTSLETETAYPNLDAAQPIWRAAKAGEAALLTETLAALLERARLAIPDEIAPVLETAQTRSQHLLELDRARLNGYYDDLQRDLEKRLTRAEDERRPALEAKLAALRMERQSKLVDAEQKYHLHIDVELINLAIISQPKIETDVEISKRGVVIKRLLAWDPVRHILEPLVCDVCGQPGDGLTLCESGHLAHSACLAPQCIDCKRTFCQLCADKVSTCCVCDASVCAHSLVGCKTCGQVTCQKHAGLCHAVDGQPQKVGAASLPAATAAPKAEALKGAAAQKSERVQNVEAERPSKAGSKITPSKPPLPKKPLKPASRRAGATAQRIQVEIENNKPKIRAFALHKEREIAFRLWELTDEGIAANCQCEKGPACPADNLIHRPPGVANIEIYLMRLIRQFADEYGVTEKKISFVQLIGGRGFEGKSFSLPSVWKDPERLASAQKGFDALPR